MLQAVVREFRKNIAVLIGIDDYQHGIPKLTTAVRDAGTLARCLEDDHAYETILCLDADADLAGLRRLFHETLPAAVQPDDRLVFYFAGHGIAQDGDDGPEGFLVPQDARGEKRDSLFPMVEAAAAFEKLPAHHMLLVFDCCFAGSFRWTSTRSFLPSTQTLYRKRYERFLDHPAAQVLTSAAQDEKALDVIDGLTIGERDTPTGHSPFATALLQGLKGDADKPGPDGEKDGVITASELYMYVRDVVELAAEDRGTQQTPGLWPLPRHDRGEFLFHTPGVTAVIRDDPPLDYESNPWRGLRSYTKEQHHLFFGRTRVVTELVERVNRQGARFLAVVGASGSGKSSVVNAGLIPRICGGGDATANEDGVWWVVGPIRPASDPLSMLERAQERSKECPAGMPRLLVIDQFEEIFTMCTDPEVQEQFLGTLSRWVDGSDPHLQILVTLRADFEPQVRASVLRDLLEHGRYAIPPMTREEMREVIDGPAADKVLYYEPPGLPDRLLDDLAAMPGALPLLSFTLAELYRRYIEQDERTDRALQGADYDAIGGVVGSLQTRASELHAASPPEEQRTMRNLMLRMVSDEGGDLAKRRLLEREQEWPDPAEAGRVRTVLDRLIDARLLVSGVADGEDGQPVTYVEPAHDMLVMSWDRIRRWQRDLDEPLKLRRELWQAALDWDGDRRFGRRLKERLWHDDVRLPQVAVNLGSADPWMNALETDFVTRSAKHKERRRLRFNIAVMLIVGVLLGITIYAVFKQQEAEESAVIARQAEEAAIQSEDLATKALADAKESEATSRLAEEAAKISQQEAMRSAQEAERAADEAARQTEIADDNAKLAAANEMSAKAAQLDAERALAQTLASQARALTRLPGRGNDALATAVQAARSDALLRPGDTATAVLSEVLGSVRGPTFGAGEVSRVVLIDGTVVTGGLDGQVVAWCADCWDRSKPPVAAHAAAVTALAVDANKVIASADEAGGVRFWSLDPQGTLRPRGEAVHLKAAVRHLHVSPDGFVAGADDGSIHLAVPNSAPRLLHTLAGPPRSMDVSRDGDIAIGGEDGQITLLDRTGRELPPLQDPEGATPRGHRGWVNSVHFSPSPGREPGAVVLVSGGEDGRVIFWPSSPQTPESAHAGPVQAVRFDPSGRWVASASWDGTVGIWHSGKGDAGSTGASLKSLPGHGAWVWSVDWLASGRMLISAGEDGTARVWSFSPSGGTRAVARLTGHDGGVRSARFVQGADGLQALTAGGDGHARLWSITGAAAEPISNVGVDLRRAAGTGSVIASISGIDTGSVWRQDPEAMACPAIFKASAVAVTPSGTALFGTSDGRLLRTQGVSTVPLQRSPGAHAGVTAVAAAQTLVAAGDDAGALEVWLSGPSGPATPLQGHGDEIFSISVESDALLTVGRDRRVLYWQPGASTRPTELAPNARPMTATLAGPDRAFIGLESGLVESWTRQADAWIRTSDACLALDSPVRELRASPDGRFVAAVDRDGTAVVLDTETLSPLGRYDGEDILSVLFDAHGGLITVTRDGAAIRRATALVSYQRLACSWLAQSAHTSARQSCDAL